MKLNISDNISFPQHIRLTISESIYHSDITGRGFYKGYNSEVSLFYGIKVYDLKLNSAKDVKREILAYNKQVNKPAFFPKIHFYTVENDSLYVVMDWIEGKTAATAFREPPVDSFELKLRLSFCIEICNVLQEIHNCRMLHRDLKPENIIVQNIKNPINSIAIIDFGLSSVMRSVNQPEGTIMYQAPEQEMRINNIGVWTDIFSLGQVIYFILNGRALELYPNEDYTTWSPLRPLPLPAKYQSEIYKNFLNKILAYNPRNRYQKVSEVTGALNALKRGIQ